MYLCTSERERERCVCVCVTERGRARGRCIRVREEGAKEEREIGSKMCERRE
jgi:hypothetical protein